MKSVLIQISCCLFLCIPTIIFAFASVWPSYTITILKGLHSPIGYSISSYDANLIGSFPMLGSLIGTIVGSFISESLGRKKTEILCGLLFVLSWSLTTTAKSVSLILVARLILGLGAGVHMVTALVYVSEITQPSLSGMATIFLMFTYSLGTLISYIIGWFCSYYVICYINLSISVAFVAIMCLLKDSPGYLIGRGKEKEALSALKFYRGVSRTSQEVLDEFAYIKQQRQDKSGKPGLEKLPIGEENEKLKPEDEKQIKEDSAWKVLCTSKASQRALITIGIVTILCILTGIAGIQAYAGQLFMMAVPGLSPDFCSVILAVVMTVSGGMSLVVTNMFKRRTVLLMSTTTTTLSLFVLGTMLKWPWAPRWAIPCMVLLYSMGFQIGGSCIPFMQLGECLLPQVKSLGTSIITSCLFISSFISLIIFVPLVENLGLDSTFFIFGTFSAVATLVIYFIVKETKDVSIEEIQDMFEKGYLCRYPIKS